jgi:hypothetical protein
MLRYNTVPYITFDVQHRGIWTLVGLFKARFSVGFRQLKSAGQRFRLEDSSS